jgi:hypothetical protein
MNEASFERSKLASLFLEHRAEKWEPVFRNNGATTKR